MANIEVKFTGNISDLEKKIAKAKASARKFVEEVTGRKRTARAAPDTFEKTAKSAGNLQKILKGGLGLSFAATGVKLFGKTVDEVMSRARRQAALTQAAFESAFSSTVGFNIQQDSFKISSREQAVQLGRDAQAQLNEVQRQLRDNFSRFVDSDAIAGSIEKALTAASLLGIGDDQLLLLRTLKEQETRLQSQVTQYNLIVNSLTEANKLATNLKNKGFTPNDGLTGKQRARDFLTSSPAPVFDTILGDPFAQLDVLNKSNERAKFLEQNSARNLAQQLPDLQGVKETNEAFGQFTASLLALERASSAGVIPSIDGVNQRISLLQQQLIVMLEQGIKPTDEAFLLLQGKMQQLQGESESFENGLAKNAIAFNILSDIGNDVLSGITFKFERATSAAARFRNTLRGIGNRLLNVGLSAGLQVGISALTGNPVSFLSALGSVVGANSSGFAGKVSGVSSNVNNASRTLEVVPGVLAGGDILIGLRDANASRIGRGGRIDI